MHRLEADNVLCLKAFGAFRYFHFDCLAFAKKRSQKLSLQPFRTGEKVIQEQQMLAKEYHEKGYLSTGERCSRWLPGCSQSADNNILTASEGVGKMLEAEKIGYSRDSGWRLKPLSPEAFFSQYLRTQASQLFPAAGSRPEKVSAAISA